MNKEKLKGYWEKVRAALGKVSKKIWILVAVAVAVVIAAVVFYINTRPYATLVTGASNEELASVTSWLDSQGITNYRMPGAGTILVPESQATSLRAKLLQEQYSRSDSGYTAYFERVSALSTVKDRDNAWLITLIEVIQNTIRKFDGVRDVSVNIELGENRGYVLDTNNKVGAKAAVLLTMENGRTLTTGQVNAIRNYISHSIAEMNVESVSIDDTAGTPYNGQEAPGTAAAASSALKIQMEQYWSQVISSQVENVLLPFYGKDNVKVSANCTVEVGDKTINRYNVTLPKFAQDGSTGGRGIVDKQFFIYEFVTPDNAAVGGVVGTPSNAQLPTYVEQGNAQAQLEGILKEQQDIYYDNNKEQIQMVVTACTLSDVTVSVSVNSTTGGAIDTDNIIRHAAFAAGLKVPADLEGMTDLEYLSRMISVMSGPFYVPPTTPTPPVTTPNGILGIPYWVIIAAGIGLLVFVILLTVILLLRSRRRRKQEEEQRAVDELLAVTMAQQPGELGPDGEPVQPRLDENGQPVSGADVMDLHTERSMELRQGIRDFVDENMEVAALLIKSWLKEDGDSG